MHNLDYIITRNARAMEDADKHGMGRRPDLVQADRPTTTRPKKRNNVYLRRLDAQRATRKALIRAALDFTGAAGINRRARLFEAALAYRQAHE